MPAKAGAIMPEFCDVALAVPLDAVFTYRIPAGMQPVTGGRILVPFRQQRLSGIVTELHDRELKVKARLKDVIRVLDSTPVLDEQLLRLGKWIADYYLAPLGEVFRTMLPLSAEFKRTIAYKITETGLGVLHSAGTTGSSARARNTAEDQMAEIRVLEYLAEDRAQEAGLRVATGASKALLAGMVRKKWVAYEDISDVCDASRTSKNRYPQERLEGKLNANQRMLIDALAAAGGRVPVEALRSLEIPSSTLNTLVKRGLVELVEEPAERSRPAIEAPRPSPFGFQFNPAQQKALEEIQKSVSSGKFSGMLLHGITGSGKTAVYLAGMRSVLAGRSGRSAILLVRWRSGLTCPPSPPICTRSLGRKSPFCIRRSPIKNGPSNGIASSVERLGLSWERVRRSSRRWLTSR